MLNLSLLLFMFRLSLNKEVKYQVSQVFLSNKVARDKLNYLNLLNSLLALPCWFVVPS